MPGQFYTVPWVLKPLGSHALAMVDSPSVLGEPETFWDERDGRLLLSLLLSWAKAEKDNEESRKKTRREGDEVEESATRTLMRHGGKDVAGEGTS